ncbi:DUF3800 domain-containing protein [bacterium]|nr:DUF3800 domain-containing protein [bacterium]
MIMTHKQTDELLVFIDESGQHDLDISKEGASNLFVCTAIIINEQNILSVTNKMRDIRNVHFNGNEIKSKNIGSKHKRRIKILNELTPLDFSYIALVVDKSRIIADSGLANKQSFYKYFNRMLYNRFSNVGCDISIIADEIGGVDFMNSFTEYMKSNLIPNLFTEFNHSFYNSSDQLLIQLADLVAGTLTYCFDRDKTSEFTNDFRKLLNPKEIAITGWPPKREFTKDLNESSQSEVDWAIYDTSITRALTFIEQHINNESSSDSAMQAATLSHLLYLKEYERTASDQSAQSTTLIELLHNLGYESLSKEQFRANIIAPLRDANILIAGTAAGYRLATCTTDIQDYVTHTSSIVGPMISRLSKAQELIKVVTAGQYDILGTGGFHALRAMVSAQRESELSS